MAQMALSRSDGVQNQKAPVAPAADGRAGDRLGGQRKQSVRIEGIGTAARQWDNF